MPEITLTHILGFITGFGSRNATLTLYAKGEESEWLFFTGCFRGTLEELMGAINIKHEGIEFNKYKLAVDYLLTIARANVKGDQA
ncbi:MAG: hypothetical protein R3Y56_08440 [Akkermansia sp.]